MSNNNSSKAAEKTTTKEATWPDFAAGLYDKLVGGKNGITYEFEDMELFIPAKLGEESDHFHWKMNGAVKVRMNEEENANK